MMEFFYYLLKVIACSGILFLYYHLALRNKEFHQWNRFYLLIAVVLSLVLPLIQFTVYRQLHEQPAEGIQLLQVVQSANEYLEEVTIYSSKPETGYDVLLVYYCIISMIIFLIFLRSVIRVISIIRSAEPVRIDEVRFIHTTVPGTPFTFFHYIFWNSDIELSTESGQRIFSHELVHVKENHSIDRLFMQLVLFVFWCNPFFWFIQREIRTIHEFIADRKSLAGQDSSAFAAMILQSAFPRQFNSISNHFFQTSIKRRFHMLNKIQNPKANYFYRIAVLPLIALTVLAFTVRTKTFQSPEPLKKKMTVILDAGHGKKDGKFTGAQMQDQYEDVIVLSIADKVKELNKDPNLEIVLARPSDELVSLERRVALATATGADLFISLHIGASPNNADKSGIEVMISGKQTGFDQQNEIFASLLTKELNSVYPTRNYIRQTSGVYVLDKTPCPTVLLELGYLTNKTDFNFIQQSANQELVANRILSAIEKFSTATSESIRIIPATEDRPLTNTKPDSTHLLSKNNKETKLTVTERNETNMQSTTSVIEKNELKNEMDGPVFTAVEIEASVDKNAWREFLTSNLNLVIQNIADKAPPGSHTAFVRFIVHKDGHLSDFTITKDPGYGFGNEILKIMDKSPRWKPAIQNGKPVNSYHTQPVTLVIDEDQKEETPSLERIKTMTLRELIGVENDVEILSCKFITGLADGKLLELNLTGNTISEPGRRFIENLTPGMIFTIEYIMISKNGKVLKHPAKLYQL